MSAIRLLPSGRYRTAPSPKEPTLIGALVFGSTAFALAASANARPVEKQVPTTVFYMERASQNHDNGGQN
jgi:hypothetical protein